LSLIFCVIVGCQSLIWPSIAVAQPLKIATRIIPPFVIQNSSSSASSPKNDRSGMSGFSVELWEKIAKELRRDYQFIPYATLPEMLNAVKNGQANAAIAAISITAEREKQFDFSYPMFSSGLKIMVRHPKLGQSIGSTIGQMFSPALLQIVVLALGMVFFAAHVVWLTERGHRETMISRRYFPGIFEAAWWAGATLATQADQMPRSIGGRITAILWMFTAVVFVAYFTATFTTMLTVQKLQGDIQGLKDLSGRVVATVAGSTSAEFLRDRHVEALEVKGIEEAYTALSDKKVDAVVYDAPILMYYAANAGQGKVILVGDSFRDENYGIALPNNSPIRKPINSALLTLKENGIYQQINDRWFKPAQGD
jgi:polar amino acid transport system substrate-binding protein